MKLIRYGNEGNERPGLLLADGRRVDATAVTDDFNEAFFAGNGLQRLRQWAEREGAAAPAIADDVRWAAPVARPSKLICVGLNYRMHALESGLDIPTEPVLFFKSTTAIVGPYDAIRLPRGSEKTDWEVELAIVIGSRLSYADKDEAKRGIAGYVLHNDVSERAYQLERGGQWVKGKSCDTFAPLGPWVATADDVENPDDLRLWLKLNGETVQDSTTADMVFDTTFLVSYISQFMTLLPGDVITTGTPFGVGLGMTPNRYLKAGDVVELGIDGLGVSRQQVVA